MRYGIGDMITVFLLGIVLGACTVALAVVDARSTDQQTPFENAAERVLTGGDDAVGIANCIAEYDYTHPGRSKFTNLVRGIRWCNVIDRAVARDCITPCTVFLPQGTLEDEFKIDYGWRRGHPLVRVKVAR